MKTLFFILLNLNLRLAKCEEDRKSDLYWEQDFYHPNGNIVYDCQGYSIKGKNNYDRKEIEERDAQKCSERNRDGSIKNRRTCDDFWRQKFSGKPLSPSFSKNFSPGCQVHCGMVKEANICHDTEDGSLVTSPDHPQGSGNQRYCVFSAELNKAAFDNYFKFPEPPNTKEATCEPKQHDCGFINRQCLHHNKTYDRITKDGCALHPYYCAVEHPDWTSQFDTGLPDCLSLNLENFSKYLIDIQLYSSKQSDIKYDLTRSFVCVCDYPIKTKDDRGDHFLSCRENVQNVFDKVRSLPHRDQCNVINAKTIHGYSNFIYNEGQFDAEEAKNRQKWLSQSYKFCMSEETQSNIWNIALIVIGMMVLLVTIIYFAKRRRGQNRNQNQYYNPSEGSNPTATTGYSNRPERETTAFIVNSEGKETLDGSVETKVIPHILKNYEKFRKKQGILEKNIVLLGETDLTLESVLQKRKLNEHNYLNILIDISWWLMELHGENKGWKVFYAAIEPSKIGLVEINGNYHAYIMNYKMAQDIARSTRVTINDHKSINYKYQPPEMINSTEKYEARSVLSADVYGFACIAWKILRVISDSSDEIDPSEDPFDREIESLPNSNSNIPNIKDPLMEKTNVYCSMKVIFQDISKRPAFGRINKEKYSNIIKIIKECWSVDPPLRLTSAQLYHRLIELSSINYFDSPS